MLFVLDDEYWRGLKFCAEEDWRRTFSCVIGTQLFSPQFGGLSALWYAGQGGWGLAVSPENVGSTSLHFGRRTRYILFG